MKFLRAVRMADLDRFFDRDKEIAVYYYGDNHGVKSLTIHLFRRSQEPYFTWYADDKHDRERFKIIGGNEVIMIFAKEENNG